MDVSTDTSSSVLSSATSGLLIHQRHTSFLLQCFWYLSIPFDFSFSLHLHVLYTHFFFFLHIIYFFPMLLLLLSRFSRVWLCATPQTAAHQAPPSLGFSRQEQWSGLPFPSPMHESEKWKWSCSVVSDSSGSHGLQPTRLLRSWDFSGKNTGVGCHCLLRMYTYIFINDEWSYPLSQQSSFKEFILKWHSLRTQRFRYEGIHHKVAFDIKTKSEWTKVSILRNEIKKCCCAFTVKFLADILIIWIWNDLK